MVDHLIFVYCVSAGKLNNAICEVADPESLGVDAGQPHDLHPTLMFSTCAGNLPPYVVRQRTVVQHV